MAKPRYGRFGAPGSLAQLSKNRGFDSGLVGFLLPFARQDYVYWEDDFLDDTMNATFWDVDADATATTFAAGTLESGNLQGQTGTTDNGGHGLKFAGVSFAAARNCGVEIRFKIDVITANGVQVEFGFSDPVTDLKLPVCDNIDTPTSATDNGQTDFAVIHLDGDATLKTAALITDGGTDTAAKVNFPIRYTMATLPQGPSNVPPTGTATTHLTAEAWQKWLVQCNTRRAFATITKEGASTTAPSQVFEASIDTGPDAAVLMRPQYFVRTRNTTDHITDIDYIRMWSERN